MTLRIFGGMIPPTRREGERMLEPVRTLGIIEDLRDLVLRASRHDDAQLALPLDLDDGDDARAFAQSLETVPLQSLVDALPEAIGIVDAAGCTIVRNRAARAILGHRQARELAEGTAESMPRQLDGAPDDPRELPVARTLRDGTTIRGETMLVRNIATGQDVPILLSSTPLRGEDGAIVGAVVMYRDISALLERERERDAFLRLVSHEVKSPLTAVRGHVAHALRLLRRGEPELAEA